MDVDKMHKYTSRQAFSFVHLSRATQTVIMSGYKLPHLYQYLLIKGYGYGVQRHFQQHCSYFIAVSFIEGNRSTWRKPPTCHKSLKNLIT